eukprot:156263-Rhodomonas_salina.1
MYCGGMHNKNLAAGRFQTDFCPELEGRSRQGGACVNNLRGEDELADDDNEIDNAADHTGDTTTNAGQGNGQ